MTRKVIEDLIHIIDEPDRERILRSDKEYCIITLHVFNAGSYVDVELSNDVDRVEEDSICLATSEVINLID